MKNKSSIIVESYKRELFEQNTPYLQMLKKQYNELEEKYGDLKASENKENFTGQHVFMLPFLSCEDDISTAIEHITNKYRIDDLRIIKDAVIIFFRENGNLSEYATREICSCFANDKKTGIAYADEDYLGSLHEFYGIEENEFDTDILKEYQKYSFGQKKYRGKPWLKPEFSPDTLFSYFYFGSVFAIRGDVLIKVFLENNNYSIYQTIKQAVRLCDKICHINKVLYTNYDIERIDELPGYEKQDKLSSNEDTLISIIIPSKDNSEILRKCIGSLVEKTRYTNYEIIIVDNGSCKEEAMCIRSFIEQLMQLNKALNIQYLFKSMPFNFSQMCNMGARLAKGEYLLFLNDDIEIMDAKWLNNMMFYACKRHVGAVGAKLYYPKAMEDEKYKIQHVGITNMGIGPAHKLCRMSDEGNLYHGHNIANYNMLAVTGACLLVNKDKYNSVNGFDEELAVAYNDVEFCFKLFENGLYNVQVNSAVLIHHESLSRGMDVSAEKEKRLYEEKKLLYKKHPDLLSKDPFYNSNLIQNKKDIEYNVNFEYEYEKKADIIFENSKKTNEIQKRYLAQQNCKENRNIISKILDRIEGVNLPMFNIDSVTYEEDKIIIDGWYVLREHDNAGLKRKLLLVPQDSTDKIYSAKICPMLRYDVDKLFTEDLKTSNTKLSGIHVEINKNNLDKGAYFMTIVSENDRKNYMSFVDDEDKKIRI